MDITLAKDKTSGSGTSVTEKASFGRHRKLTGVNVTDNYNVEQISLFTLTGPNTGTYKYGP